MKKEKKKIVCDTEREPCHGTDYIEHDGSFSNCRVCDERTCGGGYCSWDEK